jgi:hypothetical protein
MHVAKIHEDHLEAISRDIKEPELLLAARVQAFAKTDLQIRPFGLLPNLTSATQYASIWDCLP